MKEKAGQVMARRIEAVKLAVKHVRKPGQRMPIEGMDSRKGPEDGWASETLDDMVVGSDVEFVIVAVLEIAAGNLPVRR